MLEEYAQIMRMLLDPERRRADFEGKHFRVSNAPNNPKPLQPRIPIWVVGAFPSNKSMSRALRFDGVLPNMLGPDGKVSMEPLNFEKVSLIRDYVRQHRPNGGPYDIIVEGVTQGDARQENAERMKQWQEAGATWWIEALWEAHSLEEVIQRVRQGPPGR